LINKDDIDRLEKLLKEQKKAKSTQLIEGALKKAGGLISGKRITHPDKLIKNLDLYTPSGLKANKNILLPMKRHPLGNIPNPGNINVKQGLKVRKDLFNVRKMRLF